jgi:folate-binding protein YgfZ
MNSSGFFVQHPPRGQVKITGPDRRTFLQGLVTNDVALLDTQSLVYACLLTPQGKFLHDFFMSEQDDTIFIECEGLDRTHDLAKTLARFKLRSNIVIEPIDSIDVYTLINPPPLQGGGLAVQDPRHPALGYRTHTRPDHLPEHPFTDWDQIRIRHAVPDGSRDLIPGQSTLDEAHMDTLNAVSYTKGCYMGQELTARMHYRGLGKKHLIPVTGDTIPPPNTDLITPDGAVIGTIRSVAPPYALALIRDDLRERLGECGLSTS